MKAKALLPVLFVLLFSASASAEKIIIINESEQHVFALDDVLLSGNLGANRLSIVGSGEVIAGENVKVYLFGPASDVLVTNLLVNNRPTTVSFDKRGYYFVADEGVFNLEGTLEVRTIGQLRLRVPGPLNHLHFRLKNGYAVGGDRFGLYDSEVVVQRVEKVAMLTTGAFKYTFAERDTFYYKIDFKSFGSTLGGYTIDLRNGETVQSVSGALKWEQKGNKLVLELEGESRSVTVSGSFSSTNLRIPLSEGRHHVLVESDPEKKITITTGAREVDVSESPLHPTYGNARAFLASYYDTISVSVKKLGLLPSLAASVRSASNKIAITSAGSIVGEVVYSYANTGVDYLEVDAPGTPLYASTGYKAVKLTKEDKLFLALPKTSRGSLDVVYFTTRGKLKPFDVIDVPLAKTDLPISQASTSIFLPSNIFVLETLGVKGGSELPTAEAAILFVVIVGGIGLLVRKQKRFALYYIILSLGTLALNSQLFLLLQAAAIFLALKQRLEKSPAAKYLAVGVAAVAIIAIVLIAGLGLISQVGIFSLGGASRSVAYDKYAGEAVLMEQAVPAPAMKGMQRVGTGDAAITVPTREGVLPVKLEIPRMGKSITVTNHLVTKEKPVKLTLIVCASWLKYILYLAALFAALGCARMIKKEKGM